MDNVFLEKVSGSDNVEHILRGHVQGNRGVEALNAAAKVDPSEWPEEWRRYERKSYPRFDSIDLPVSHVNVDNAIERRSVRNMAASCLTTEQIGQILNASQMEVDSDGRVARRAPSAGALYPIEIYLLSLSTELPRSSFYFDAEQFSLVTLFELPETLIQEPAEALGLTDVGYPSVIVVLTAVLYRTMRKYASRGYRYALLEAGAIAQEIDRASRLAGLSATWLGGFDDIRLCSVLGIRSELEYEVPLICLAIGQTAARGKS